MVNSDKLKIEIESDPKELGYLEKTDIEVTDLLNEVNRVRYTDASKDSVLKYLIRKQKWLAIADSTESVARNAVALLNTQSFDVNGAESTGLLDGLVALELLDSEDKKEIQLMGQRLISRATEIGVGHVRVGYVEKVRAWQ